ncbi:unnamed protein product [Haemonchus placei]|uniref:Lipoprotein n=1 Tax=Haemonchus placei TaxID=6290 RepID=A0A0N4XB48_HAEPC|nr:unnamed protein product [Haemonchus placei]
MISSMLRPTILVAIIGFVTGCTPTTTVPGSVTAETTILSLMPYSKSDYQSLQQMYERMIMPKLAFAGDVKSIQVEDVNGILALKYTLTDANCTAVKEAFKSVIETTGSFANATTTCS